MSQGQMPSKGNSGEMMGQECRNVNAGMRIRHSFVGEKFLPPRFQLLARRLRILFG